jgi:hypothetical protein
LGEKNIKYGQEILDLLDAVWAPKWVAVIHCRGHQKGDATIAWGSQKADKEVKQTAFMRGLTPTALTTALFPCPLAEWDQKYTQEQTWFKTEKGSFLLGRWWKFVDGCIAIPELLAPTFVKQFHEGTHSGQMTLETTLAQHFYALQHR